MARYYNQGVKPPGILDTRKSTGSGPVTVRMMTEEERAKYGPPVKRRCQRCGRELPLTAKYFSRNSNGGLYYICKECLSSKRKDVDSSMTDQPTRACSICGKELPETEENFYYRNGKPAGTQCKKCIADKQRERDKSKRQEQKSEAVPAGEPDTMPAEAVMPIIGAAETRTAVPVAAPDQEHGPITPSASPASDAERADLLMYLFRRLLDSFDEDGICHTTVEAFTYSLAGGAFELCGTLEGTQFSLNVAMTEKC